MLRIPSRGDLLKHLPMGSVGAELGVFDGVFSQEILQTVRPSRLYLVDLWDQTTEIVRFDDHGCRYVHRLVEQGHARRHGARRVVEPIPSAGQSVFYFSYGPTSH